MSQKLLCLKHLKLPDAYPSADAMASCKENKTNYEPELWELQYHSYRYLSGLSNEDLQKRYSAIIKNMKALTSPDRHIIPIVSMLSSWYWYRKEHQTRYEMALRNLQPQSVPPKFPPENTNKKAPHKPSGPNACDVIYRYTNYNYAQKMLNEGEIRIGAASLVENVINDTARFDKELTKDSYLPGEYTKITTADGQVLPIIGDFCTTKTVPDYFFFCMSCDWDEDLFKEFSVDACVIIKNVKEFSRRVKDATQKQLAHFTFWDLPVDYYDPYEKIKNQYIDAALSKTLHYAYQREYRLLWQSEAAAVEGYKYLKLGSLTDIAEIHTLK